MVPDMVSVVTRSRDVLNCLSLQWLLPTLHTSRCHISDPNIWVSYTLTLLVSAYNGGTLGLLSIVLAFLSHAAQQPLRCTSTRANVGFAAVLLGAHVTLVNLWNVDVDSHNRSYIDSNWSPARRTVRTSYDVGGAFQKVTNADLPSSVTP